MYDINTKNVTKGNNFFLIFLVAGIISLIIILGILISSYINLKSLDSTTTATRVIVNSQLDDEGTRMYSPTYYYMVNGEEYSCSSSTSSSIKPGKDKKTVYYDSKNPTKCMTEYSKTNNIFILFFLIIPILFITIAVVNIRSINKRLKVVNQLNQKGKLIKNLPYHLENTGITVNNVQIQRPVVEYTLPSGSTITLYGDPRYDKKEEDTDGMVDIVIDENNPSNYYIDYEINRLSGNLPSDYYNEIPNNEVQSNDMNYQINNQNQNITNNNMNSNIVPENNTNIQQNPTITQQEQSQNQIVQNNNEQFNINSNNNSQNNMF